MSSLTLETEIASRWEHIGLCVPCVQNVAKSTQPREWMSGEVREGTLSSLPHWVLQRQKQQNVNQHVCPEALQWGLGRRWVLLIVSPSELLECVTYVPTFT